MPERERDCRFGDELPDDKPPPSGCQGLGPILFRYVAHATRASAHACGGLTDLILDRAVAVGARVAVLPCCHDLKDADLGGLQGWLDGPLAMDAVRVFRLRSCGYKVFTQQIPGDITPKNRLLLAETE